MHLKTKEIEENLCQEGLSQDLPHTYCLLTKSPADTISSRLQQKVPLEEGWAVSGNQLSELILLAPGRSFCAL
jgi:hypothetical protein